MTRTPPGLDYGIQEYTVDPQAPQAPQAPAVGSTVFQTGTYAYDGLNGIKKMGSDTFAYGRSRLTSAFYSGTGGGTQGFTYWMFSGSAVMVLAAEGIRRVGMGEGEAANRASPLRKTPAQALGE